jgi:hypothetical protein
MQIGDETSGASAIGAAVGSHLLLAIGRATGRRDYTLDQFQADFGPLRNNPPAIKNKLIEISQGRLNESNVDGACEHSGR